MFPWNIYISKLEKSKAPFSLARWPRLVTVLYITRVKYTDYHGRDQSMHRRKPALCRTCPDYAGSGYFSQCQPDVLNMFKHPVRSTGSISNKGFITYHPALPRCRCSFIFRFDKVFAEPSCGTYRVVNPGQWTWGLGVNRLVIFI